MTNDIVWDAYKDYSEYVRVSNMSVMDMLKEFHDTYEVDRSNMYVAHKLVNEEYDEFVNSYSDENRLKEMADLVYVIYGYAERKGWDLDEALTFVHISNMSKLGDDGKPIRREDGKVLKGPNYKEPNLKALVA